MLSKDLNLVSKCWNIFFSKPGMWVPSRGLDSIGVRCAHYDITMSNLTKERWKSVHGLREDYVRKRVVLTPFHFTQSRLNRLIDFKSRRLVSFFISRCPYFASKGPRIKNNTLHATYVASISWNLGLRAVVRSRPRTHQTGVHGFQTTTTHHFKL